MFKMSRSDLADKVNQTMAAGTLVLAAVFITDAASRVMEGDIVKVMDFISIGAKALGLGLAALIALLIFMKWRLGRQGEPVDRQGFTDSAVKQACSVSWLITFFVLATQTDRLFVAASPEYVVDVTLSIMLGLYGVSYFIFDQFAEQQQ